jgi:hypothetical protein
MIKNDFNYPSETHYCETFDNVKWNKSNGFVNNGRSISNKIDKIKHKQIHTFVPSIVAIKDMRLLEEKGIKKDSNGLIKVERNNTTRFYKQHEDSRLYPVGGDFTLSLPGSVASEAIEEFMHESPEESMTKFLLEYRMEI